MVPGSKSTRTARGTYLLPEAYEGQLYVCKSAERTHYLVEVDVHALQLEVGGTIVAVADQYSELVVLRVV